MNFKNIPLFFSIFITKFWPFVSCRYLNTFFIKFTTITIILVTFLNLIIALSTSSGGRNIFGSWAGGDYSCFYVAGKILNNFPPDRLYDFRLQSQLLHSLLPQILPFEELPYVNPPFFALIFKPLSILPFIVSYCVWMLFSVILYIFGFRLFWMTLASMPKKTSKVALLSALSFEPFIIETVLGGNSSAFAFFSFSLFIYFWHCKKDLLSGFSLGILLYKPTLLIFIFPMLLIARKTKILIGFCIFSLIALSLSILAVGIVTCFEYLRFLFGISYTVLGFEEIFRTWKYVDIFSFSRLLFGAISPAVLILIITSFLIPIIFIIKWSIKLNSLNQNNQNLLIAISITMTTIINLHFAIYDTVILILPILLTADFLYRNTKIQNSDNLINVYSALLVLIYILPWISQHVARVTGFQLFSLGIAILGIYQILIARTYFKISGLLYKQYPNDD